MTQLIRRARHSGALRLSPGARRLLLLTHMTVSIAWIGVDLVMGVLAVTGAATDDPALLAVCYRALDVFAVPLLLPLGLASLFTGVLLGLGTRYGLLRFWWVAVKLVLNVVLVVLVVVALRPGLEAAATASTTVDPSLALRLGDARTQMLFPPVVSTTVLLVATVLGVYKPWGPTPRGRRFTRTASRARGRQQLTEKAVLS